VDGPRQVTRRFVPSVYRRHACDVCRTRWNTYEITEAAMTAAGKLVTASQVLAGRLYEVEGAG
jgi:transcriptional regulator NrdR family protein